MRDNNQNYLGLHLPPLGALGLEPLFTYSSYLLFLYPYIVRLIHMTSGTGGQTLFDRLTVLSRLSHLILNEQAHFSFSHMRQAKREWPNLAKISQDSLILTV